MKVKEEVTVKVGKVINKTLVKCLYPVLCENDIHISVILFGQWTIYRSIYGLFLGRKVTKARRCFERLPIQPKEGLKSLNEASSIFERLPFSLRAFNRFK